ncbi:hypothetical protein BC829DRAFT_415760 [Chytridium lagenaria]|nr:hypothetical protein BC829DRAFT_415760 [Chytridium lagenaria]
MSVLRLPDETYPEADNEVVDVRDGWILPAPPGYRISVAARRAGDVEVGRNDKCSATKGGVWECKGSRFLRRVGGRFLGLVMRRRFGGPRNHLAACKVYEGREEAEMKKVEVEKTEEEKHKEEEIISPMTPLSSSSSVSDITIVTPSSMPLIHAIPAKPIYGRKDGGHPFPDDERAWYTRIPVVGTLLWIAQKALLSA